jgi:UDP-N-acetylglucosamine 2-epimerase (non-hydrolysing)/GDP/UDP-N,N'-diacetylbacillosamine 2-epimerase (hydrolysing)
MYNRKIAIVTGSRAEYGLLYWLMREIDDDSELELQIIVTGAHLSPEFGLSYKKIEEDGFSINEKLEILLSSDTSAGMAKSLGLGIIGFADVLQRLQPDILVLLGDRYEILAAAQAAMLARIPIAHIAGGEITEGAVDEAIRHSITKMSHLHFVAAETYRKRVIQLGEDPTRVFNYGSTGLDNIKRIPLLDRQELEEELDFELGQMYFLVTYHPVTLEKSSEDGIRELLIALNNYPDANFIITGSNADRGGRTINSMLEEYALENQARVLLCKSLGQLKYLSALKYCHAVIGNSSSGIIEAPALNKATVNIGSRQQGRLKADSIIDCQENRQDITKAIDRALSAEFQEKLAAVQSLYGNCDASGRIKEELKYINLTNILRKRFYDIELY